MNKILLTFLVVCSFVLPAFGQTKPPRSVKNKIKEPPVAAVKTAESLRTIGVTIERYRCDYEINRDGTSIQTIEMVRRYVTPIAIENFNKYEKVFNADLESVEILEAYTLDAAGKKTPLEAKSFGVKPTPQAEAAPAFSSLSTAEIKFENLKIGDRAGFKMRVARKKPVFNPHFDAIEYLPAIFEWKTAEINFSAPADFPLFVQAVDLEGGRATDAADGRARWQWRKQNLAAKEFEALPVSLVDISPRVAVTSFRNYEELGAAYWAEARKQATVTPEIKKLAEEITQNIVEPKEQAAAIYDWANRNVRYVSIVLGRGGWIPHDAASILQNRYGDCKDYTTLLQALLAAKNIESHPVIIRAENGSWMPEVAASQFFNHAILYIPSLDIFADATLPNSRLGLLQQQLIGKSGFLAGERTGKIKIPSGKPEDNQVLSEIAIELSPLGSLRAVSKNVYVGRSELLFRPLFADGLLMQIGYENFFRVMMSHFGMIGTGKMLKISDSHRVNEPFAVEMEITLGDHTTFMPKGSLNLPVALNLNSWLELEKLVAAESRQTNLLIGASRFKEDYKIKFPASVKVVSVPAAVKMENAAGVYASEYKIMPDGSVALDRSLVFRKDIYAPEEYGALRELIKKVIADFNEQISYTADAALAKEKSAAMRQKPRPKKTGAAENALEEMFEEPKPLARRERLMLETKLKQNPADVSARIRLLRALSPFGEERETPARVQARIEHRRWFVENRPETLDSQIYGWRLPDDEKSSEEYKILKAAWFRQIEARGNEPLVRLNAARFFDSVEPEIAEKLLLEGERIAPENYEFSLKLFELYGSRAQLTEAKNAASGETRKSNLTKAFQHGSRAWQLLKKERSKQRTRERAGLLPRLSKTAFDIEKLTEAKMMATEFLLDFGDDADNANYVEAAHIGNVALGRIAVAENDLARAKEHLLRAARAPLRAPNAYLEPDLDLARELFQKGEKQTVVEYLQLCEGFKTHDDGERLKALRRWQNEIKAGKTPNFDESEF
jgi:hypothetical protein